MQDVGGSQARIWVECFGCDKDRLLIVHGTFGVWRCLCGFSGGESGGRWDERGPWVNKVTLKLHPHPPDHLPSSLQSRFFLHLPRRPLNVTNLGNFDRDRGSYGPTSRRSTGRVCSPRIMEKRRLEHPENFRTRVVGGSVYHSRVTRKDLDTENG